MAYTVSFVGPNVAERNAFEHTDRLLAFKKNHRFPHLDGFVSMRPAWHCLIVMKPLQVCRVDFVRALEAGSSYVLRNADELVRLARPFSL